MAAGEPSLRTQTLTLDGSGRLALVRQLQLLVTAGPARGQVFRTRDERTVIGSHESANLWVDDPTVSRFHCEVALDEGRPMLRDLGSATGTIVDGVEVARALMRDGAVIALGDTRIQLQLSPLQATLPLSERERFGTLVGRSPAMRHTFALLERAAGCDATVLLTGETGTGKDAAAESIHRESARRDGPFVVVDCASIPPALLESELFGHTRGAFTGAREPRVGAFEAASGGTVVLDEIGELPPELQPKLLRAVEARQIKRVGDDSWLEVDARVIAATNRDLRAEINARRFRSDLFFRLAVIEICLPPLRERVEDVPLLIERMVDELPAADAAAMVAAIAADRSGHAWPGNVRELRNYVDRWRAFGEPPEPPPATAETGPPILDATRPFKEVRDAHVGYLERTYLTEVLQVCHGNVTAAAARSGLDRAHFYRLLRRYRLR